MDGILNVLKPPGMTSHDVVGFIRRLCKIKKAGHTGTLDPDVAGVLPICLGKATKVVQYITNNDKTYRGEITFGITTDTQDASGKVTGQKDAGSLTAEQIKEIFSRFVGEIEQTPPMVSAVKVKGKKLYEYAREGIEVKRESRRINIYKIELIKITQIGSARPKAMFDVQCSKGTYIRTLCNDIGEMSGFGAHMSYLLRTKTGPFAINDALTLEEITELWQAGKLPEHLISIAAALTDMPTVVVHHEVAAKIKSGNKVFAPGVKKRPENLREGDRVCLKDSDGQCLAIACTVLDEIDKSRLHFQPVRVF